MSSSSSHARGVRNTPCQYGGGFYYCLIPAPATAAKRCIAQCALNLFCITEQGEHIGKGGGCAR